MTDPSPSDPVQAVALKACPLCGDTMAMKGQVFGHTDSDLPCILADKAFVATPEKLTAWNTRTIPPTAASGELVERLQRSHGTGDLHNEAAAHITTLEATIARLSDALKTIAQNDEYPVNSEGNPMPIRPQWSREQCSTIAREALTAYEQSRLQPEQPR